MTATTRLARVALAVALTLATTPARAHLSEKTAASQASNLSQETPPPTTSERDLAYELGVQAEALGDHARAAAAHERAYRLTTAAEPGPRLLFLRASVAARLRADDGSAATRVHLCHAQALLRDYLADPALTPELAAEERVSLQRLEQRLAVAGAPTCATLLGATPPPAPAPATPTTTTPTTAAETPRPPPPVVATPTPTPRPAITRPLRISGAVGLGLGATGLALLAAGVVVGRRANQRGHEYCSERATACVANDPVLRDIETSGRRGDTLVRVGAVLAGLGLLAGVTLLAISARKPGPRRSALRPAGLGLAGSF
ncbi:MAG: hypothetical protein IPO88_29865 [Nannocystis sp.]|uniref:hypothetical protein n=1 Tax=Nannocystis sp. TaxID=1962667 RepID=UPI0024276458|nr:hypothetical protein [Nannocystis sp.]MBK9757640.1 hypothetical protein [Nannocystis sp.]